MGDVQIIRTPMGGGEVENKLLMQQVATKGYLKSLLMMELAVFMKDVT